MKILHIYTGKVIFENSQVNSIKELVELATKQGANLRDVNLRCADLEVQT